MSTTLNHYTLFSALTLLTLGSVQMPALAISNGTVPNAKQETTAAPLQPQRGMQLAQAGSNCRMVSTDIGTVIYENSNRTGKTATLPEGTLVEINLKNVSGNFIQVTAINGTARVGFVNKMTLTLCNASPQVPKPQQTNSVKPLFPECYKIRNLLEIVKQGGLPLRQEASLGGTAAYSKLRVGEVVKAANPPEQVTNDFRWIRVTSKDGISGYVSDGPAGDPVRNLEPVTCPK